MLRVFAFIIIRLVAQGLLYSQSLDYGKAIVKTLSSEEFAGRGFVEEGIDKAANFIQKEYKKNNILPIGEGYLQTFPVDVNTFNGYQQLIIDDSTFQLGVNYIVDPSSPSIKGEYKIYVAQKDELLQKKQLKKLIKKIEDKILIIDQRVIAGIDKEEKNQLNEAIKYLKSNTEFKCKAVLVIVDQKLTWSISSHQSVRPVVILNANINLNKNSTVKIKVNSKLKTKYRTSNIVGIHKGTMYPDSTIVLTAHYDHLGKMDADVYIPGANDNASGVAMLLMLSKYFKNNAQKYSIVYVATTAEELGLLGARYFVENPLIDLKKIKFLVNFDLAGTGDEGIKVVNGSVFKEEFKQVKEINEAQNYLPEIKVRGEACISDHCMFYMAGVPCFYIYTLGGIKAYHDIYDKYETLPFTEFVNYSKLMIEFVEGL